MWIKPRTDDQLHALIEANLSISVPRVSVCPGHSAPFSFIADSYFERVSDCLVIGPRNGGKTIDFAALEMVEAVGKDGCESAHLGSVLSQARRAYTYINKWAASVSGSPKVKKSTREITSFDNGSAIEVIPGTINGVNSPHPHKAHIDEFELLDWEVFQEAISMPRTSNGISSALRLATTRKYPHGNAQKMINEAAARDFHLYRWCIFEVMTRCDCPGSAGPCSNRHKTRVSYDRNGAPVSWSDICAGKARRAVGYFSFEDVLKKFMTLDYETFSTQWLCQRPEKSNVVFTEFRDGNIVQGYDPTEVLEREDGWALGRGWDFGLDDPTAVGFYVFNKSLGVAVQFNELVVSGRLIEDIARDVRSMSDTLAPPSQWADWGDPSGKARTGVDGYSYISKLARHDIFVSSQFQSISDGIQKIKSKLRPHNITGKPCLFFDSRCRRTIQALELAAWDRQRGDNASSKEKYRHDEHSHPLDQLRYFLVGVFPDGKFSFGL